MIQSNEEENIGMRELMNGTCDKCFYAVSVNSPVSIGGTKLLECHRRPPIPILIQLPKTALLGPQQSHVLQPIFPPVGKEKQFFCGDFEPKWKED